MDFTIHNQNAIVIKFRFGRSLTKNRHRLHIYIYTFIVHTLYKTRGAYHLKTDVPWNWNCAASIRWVVVARMSCGAVDDDEPHRYIYVYSILSIGITFGTLVYNAGIVCVIHSGIHFKRRTKQARAA